LGIVVGFEAKSGQRFSVALEDPNGKILFEGRDAVAQDDEMYDKFRHTVRTSQVGIVLAPIGFNTEGIHHIVLRIGGRVMHREPFGVFVDPDFGPGESSNDATIPVSADASTDAPPDRPDKQRDKHRGNSVDA
jgi:hypothetical protein